MRQYIKLFFLGMAMFLWAANLFAQAPNTLWTKTYGGVSQDVGNSVQQTFDKGYIVIGYTESFGSGGDVYLVKTDSLGNTTWTKTYGGVSQDVGWSVQQTFDKGYIITGGSGGDVYLVKTDSLGDTSWTKTYGGGDMDVGYSVQQTFDKGYIIAGYTRSFGSGYKDVYLIKTDSLGDTSWTKTYGGELNERGHSVQQTFDKGYVIIGYTQSFPGPGLQAVYCVKTDSLGDALWIKSYGGNGIDEGFSIQQTFDKGYIIAGSTNSFGAGYDDVYLIKIDSLGDTTWTKTYGGISCDRGFSVQQTTDNGYIITGSTYSYSVGELDVYLIRTNDLGKTIWTNTYGGINEDMSFSVQQTSDGGYIIAGYTSSFGTGLEDVYLIKTGPDAGIEGNQTTNPQIQTTHLEVFPNPFKEKTVITFSRGQSAEDIELKIFDVTGRLVKEFLLPTVYSLLPTVISWDGKDNSGNEVQSGVYFVRLVAGSIGEAGKYQSTKKLLLLR